MSGEAESILKQRAEALALTDQSAQVSDHVLVLFLRAGQIYGIRVGEVEGGARLRDLSVVPGGPSWIVGAVQHRGRVLSLIDLPGFWGQETKGAADLPSYVVLTNRSRQVGILVEDLMGLHNIDAAPVPYEGVAKIGIADVARLRKRPVLVLSARSLFSDPRLAS